MSRGAAALWKKMDFLWDYNKGWREFFAPAKLNRYFHKRGAPTHAPSPRALNEAFASRIKPFFKNSVFARLLFATHGYLTRACKKAQQ